MEENNELVVFSEIKQDLIIDYSKESLENAINQIEDKYKNLLVAEENEKEFREEITKINKIIDQLRKYRISTEKEALKPLESFITHFKNSEKRLETVYRTIKNQLDNFEKQDMEKQLEEMKEIKKQLCTELGIEELEPYISLPEQKSSLSRKNYKKEKAEKLILEKIEQYKTNLESIKTTVQNINERSKINLDIKDYYPYIEDLATCLSKLQIEEIRYHKIKELEEQRKKQEENNTPQNTAESPKMLKEDKKGINTKLIIYLSDISKETAIRLKDFLDSNSIKYEKLTD